jgi:hypothetical protein
VETLQRLVESKYVINTVVYSSAGKCLKFPGELYLIPYGTLLSEQALAVWLPAFDQHKEIFLLGYDFEDGKNQSLANEILTIMQTYRGTKFVRVSQLIEGRTRTDTPDTWKNCRNFSEMTYTDWVSYADI